MAAQPRFYIAIDMKSFYASVECVARGYDPLTTNLLVADESRSDQTICLAVSPSLKAIGVPSRPRLFEAKQAIRKYELAHLYIKTKRWEKAYDNLSEILELYDYAMAGTLPPAYKKLAQIEMDKIPLAKLEEYQNASR